MTPGFARNSRGHLPGCVCKGCSPALQDRASTGHLPGCICKACRFGAASAAAPVRPAGKPPSGGHADQQAGGEESPRSELEVPSVQVLQALDKELARGAGPEAPKAPRPAPAEVISLKDVLSEAFRPKDLEEAQPRANEGERVGGARLGARPGRAETTLDAASLHAYAELQAALGEAAGPSASVTSTEEAAPAPKPVLQKDLASEVAAFAASLGLDGPTQGKVLELLSPAGPERGLEELQKIQAALTRARNPIGFLKIKLDDLERAQDSPARKIQCFHWKQGTCRYGERCKYAHTIVAGLQVSSTGQVMGQDFGPPPNATSAGGGRRSRSR
ncbi:unnamed protein product [Effrenium voratum]|uniref:C3H1-type domain-containing protein n=1 Tax=Effrenium voratum TaxID=2562239 RepID=A0AA36HXI3_9DINO|nr:unnamed protein product [Effrenium voratum]CAJ1413389.1 unnamed protein product [Effrenium voratum]